MFKSKNPDPLIAEFTEAVWAGGVEPELEDTGTKSWAEFAEYLAEFELDPEDIGDFANWCEVVGNSEWYDIFAIIQRIVDWAELQQAAKEWYATGGYDANSN